MPYVVLFLGVLLASCAKQPLRNSPAPNSDPQMPVGAMLAITPDTSATEPYLKLQHGIVIDRSQPDGAPPPAQIFTVQDIQLIKAMGFDHVKVLINPAQFMSASGTMSGQSIASAWRGDNVTIDKAYLGNLLDIARQGGLPVLLCVHPESNDPVHGGPYDQPPANIAPIGSFKSAYLSGGPASPQFQKLLKWYGELASFLTNYDPHWVALQLMTEPAYAPAGTWNQMSYALWNSVRSVSKSHTLVLSGDQFGKFEAMLQLQPVPDTNVYYSFTTYDPQAFAFGNYPGLAPAAMHYAIHIPYPASPEIIQANLSDIEKNYAPGDAAKDTATALLQAYGKGDLSFGAYNAAYFQKRFAPVNAWKLQYSSLHPHVLAVEFGCIDPVVTQVGSQADSGAMRAADRYAFIADLRRAFDAYGIGWSYWSYNETFTVLNPALRAPLTSASATNGAGPSAAQADLDMLTSLGLQPSGFFATSHGLFRANLVSRHYCVYDNVTHWLIDQGPSLGTPASFSNVSPYYDSVPTDLISDAQCPISSTFFAKDGNLFRASANRHYCVYDTMSHWEHDGGPAPVTAAYATLPNYTAIPNSMTFDGTCP